MGNANGASSQDPFGGRRIVIVSQNGVTIDGQPVQPEQFQQFQQQMNFNIDIQPNQFNVDTNNNFNNNISSNNVEPSAPGQDSDDSDSDSYYSDSEVNEEGINYANYVEDPNGQYADVNYNIPEQGQPQQQQGVPVILFSTAGHSSRFTSPHMNPAHPSHPSHPSYPTNPHNPNYYHGIHQTHQRNLNTNRRNIERINQQINQQSKEMQRQSNERMQRQMSETRTRMANETRANVERTNTILRTEHQRWQQNFHAQTRRIQAQNNPIRPPPRPTPPPVFRRR